jgi:hypothetical protein
LKLHIRTSSLALSAIVFGSLLALASFKSAQSEAAQPARAKPAPVSLSNEFTATAEVIAVDKARRTVTLRREDGRLLALQVGQAARNFDQIAAGDQLRVRYKESLSASLRPAGETAKAAEGGAAAGRTEAGAKPGGGVALAMSARVKIESIDAPHDIVVFSLASGELIAHRLATAEGRTFVTGLHVGDVVQLDYAEALALSVEKI